MVASFSYFRVHFYGRRPVYHTIQQITLLATYIKLYGIFAIHKIIFEFAPSSYYSHGYHNIVLYNTGNHSFMVQFYHYYNSRNQLHVLHEDCQKHDYHTLIHFLYHNPALNTLLVPYIHPAFTNDLNE